MRRSAITGGLAIALAVVALPAHPVAAPQDREHAHQMITVHGRWTLDVRNPDGALVLHREVENSLVDTGRAALAKMLSGGPQPDYWVLFLQSPELLIPIFPRNHFDATFDGAGSNLIAQVDGGAGTLTLTGSATIPIDKVDGVNIASVESRMAIPRTGLTTFTHADLDSPVHVNVKQSIDVSLTFSFGS